MKNLFIMTLFCVSLTSCEFVRNQNIVGRYNILAIDNYDEPCLGYELDNGNQICIVPGKVIAYSKNDKYIFIQQHPVNSNSLETNYFILPILENNTEVFPENIIIGPLKQRDFNIKISSMNIRNVKFKLLN